ncbi:MAG TPA: polysaccharide pyruvyl transferase family protein [Tepidisphaeraceae bacterium]|jgi:polysaccharide pyruvyl transferase WcaK-like protein
MIHHVFANKQNIGDWMSAKGIQSQLGSEEVLEHFCDEWGIESALAHLARAKADDLVVIGGGGLLMDYFSPFWEGLNRTDVKAPIVIWGVGYCDMKERPSRPPGDALHLAVEKSALCVVRDEMSRTYLGMNKVGSPVACPSLLCLHPRLTKKKLMLHVVHYEAAGEERYQAMHRLARRFAKDTGREYLETSNEIDDPGDPGEMKDIVEFYRDADVVLTSRLHGCLMAVASGAKVVAIAGDRKVDAFMEWAGLSDWVVDLKEYERARELLERVHEQPSVEARLEEARKANQQIGERVRQIRNGVRS